MAGDPCACAHLRIYLDFALIKGEIHLRAAQPKLGRKWGPHLPGKHQPLPPLLSLASVGILVLLGIALCYLIAAPFIPALVWSFTLAVLFAPVERVFRARFRSPALSVSLAMVIAATLVVAPVIFVSAALLESIIGSVDAMNALLSAGDGRGLSQTYPELSAAIVWLDNRLDLPHLLEALTQWLQGWGTSLILGSITSIINLLLTFYFLFYMLRDRAAIGAAMERLLPLLHGEFRILASRLEKTVFASVYGTAAVSALQGFLGGLVFWWLGLPSPVFWGLIMGLLGIVPFLGAFIVWVPVCVVLAVSGQWVSAIILAIWGTFIVGLIDNIVYPILVGRQLAIHSMLSFIAIVGGIVIFGAHGFVLGPLIVAGTQSLFEILRRRFDGKGFSAAGTTAPVP